MRTTAISMPKQERAESLALRFLRSATFFYCFFSLDPPAAARDCLSPEADGLLA
jgi:hypothetical protein